MVTKRRIFGIVDQLIPMIAPRETHKKNGGVSPRPFSVFVGRRSGY